MTPTPYTSIFHRRWAFAAWMFPLGLIVAALVITLHGQTPAAFATLPAEIATAVTLENFRGQLANNAAAMTAMDARMWRMEGLLYSLVIASVAKLVFDEARSRRR